jgi:hypothetical protein
LRCVVRHRAARHEVHVVDAAGQPTLSAEGRVEFRAVGDPRLPRNVALTRAAVRAGWRFGRPGYVADGEFT